MFLDVLFNIDNGYLEGLVRGFKSGILKNQDYLNLVQCETLDDLKLHLQTTDYGQFLANEPSPLSVSVIDDKIREKYVIEFQHLRNHAVEPLSKFLDYITYDFFFLIYYLFMNKLNSIWVNFRYSYMIDNIVLLITGHLHQRSVQELLPKCHPLGMFEQMGAISVADNSASLYNAILIDTPLGIYFI